jgi:hypothetical protein
MDKAGATVFKNIVNQFLHNTEHDKFLFRFQSVFVVMKTAAGIHAA